MGRELSEPAAYLRPVGPPPPAKSQPCPHWWETKAERIARLAARPVFVEPQLISFGEQLELCRAHAERKRLAELAMVLRCVY